MFPQERIPVSTDNGRKGLAEGTEEIILEPGRAERHYWRDLWQYRELLYILAWRDVAVRYKQTVIGVAWALLQPLAQMVVMVVIFSKIAGLPTEGDAPYALLVFAAMLPWQFFASSISSASMSIVSNANLISKVYFPRLIIPAAAVVTSVVDFLIAFAILVALMLWYGHAPAWRMLTLPLFMWLALLAAFGPGLLITALNTEYRDFRYVIPFIVQFGLYVSPVGFSSTVVRERFGDALFLLYSLNPMVGVIDGFRWAILGGDTPLHLLPLVLSFVLSAALLVLGSLYFRRLERRFADVV
jgi:lipopolysaccharide transport system permease protein